MQFSIFSENCHRQFFLAFLYLFNTIILIFLQYCNFFSTGASKIRLCFLRGHSYSESKLIFFPLCVICNLVNFFLCKFAESLSNFLRIDDVTARAQSYQTDLTNFELSDSPEICLVELG